MTDPEQNSPMGEPNKPKKRGWPKGRKRGRPKKKEIKDLLMAKDIIEHGIEGAYQKNHPSSTPHSTVSNAHRVLTKEVKEMVRDLLAMDQIAEVNKENLIKFYQLMLALFLKGDKRVKASDFRGAIDSLSKLVPDFKDRQLVEELGNKDESEIDEELKKFGINPDKLRFNNGTQSPSNN